MNAAEPASASTTHLFAPSSRSAICCRLISASLCHHATWASTIAKQIMQSGGS